MARLRPAGLHVLAALALAAAGCPLPQPLTDVPSTAGRAATTPLIVTDTVRPAQTVVQVGRSCADPRFALDLQVEDVDTTEQIEVRWFVDYDPPLHVAMERPPDVIPGPEDPSQVTRAVPTFVYQPDPAQPVHVVEVVVSNGFAPNTTDAVPLPNRMPADGYQTQLFRWVFELVDDPAAPCSYP